MNRAVNPLISLGGLYLAVKCFLGSSMNSDRSSILFNGLCIIFKPDLCHPSYSYGCYMLYRYHLQSEGLCGLPLNIASKVGFKKNHHFGAEQHPPLKYWGSRAIEFCRLDIYVVSIMQAFLTSPYLEALDVLLTLVVIIYMLLL